MRKKKNSKQEGKKTFNKTNKWSFTWIFHFYFFAFFFLPLFFISFLSKQNHLKVSFFLILGLNFLVFSSLPSFLLCPFLSRLCVFVYLFYLSFFLLSYLPKINFYSQNHVYIKILMKLVTPHSTFTNFPFHFNEMFLSLFLSLLSFLALFHFYFHFPPKLIPYYFLSISLFCRLIYCR